MFASADGICPEAGICHSINYFQAVYLFDLFNDNLTENPYKMEYNNRLEANTEDDILADSLEKRGVY